MLVEKRFHKIKKVNKLRKLFDDEIFSKKSRWTGPEFRPNGAKAPGFDLLDSSYQAIIILIHLHYISTHGVLGFWDCCLQVRLIG